jgi:hypothetical protein
MLNSEPATQEVTHKTVVMIPVEQCTKIELRKY